MLVKNLSKKVEEFCVWMDLCCLHKSKNNFFSCLSERKKTNHSDVSFAFRFMSLGEEIHFLICCWCSENGAGTLSQNDKNVHKYMIKWSSSSVVRWDFWSVWKSVCSKENVLINQQILLYGKHPYFLLDSISTWSICSDDPRACRLTQKSCL